MKLAAAAAVFFLAASPALAQASLVDLAKAGDRAAALKAIARKADVNAASADDGTTPLLWAVHNQDAELAKALIAAGADVKAANAYGASPMREAVVGGDVEIVGALLDAGADPECASVEGQTCLMIVARTANVEAARLLLDKGAKVNAKEKLEDFTPLHFALDQNQPEMVKLLIARGADVNARTRFHDNDIRVSAEPRVRYDPSGSLTPLLFAARQGCLECAKALVEAGARVGDYDPDGVTPLLTAVMNAHFDLAVWLIGKGADVNRWDWWGRTPLYAAVDYNSLPMGGRADRPTLDETSSLQMIEKLLAAGANPNVQLKFPPPFRDVGADRGGDLMLTTGATPLLRAAKAGDAAAMDLLLKAGARTDLTVARAWKDNVGGITAIMAAAGLGYQINDTRGKLKTQEEAIAAIDLLVAAKADINARDDRGNTALHGAVFRGWNDVVRHLIEKGADPTLANNDGKSALDAAKGNLEPFRGQAMNIDPGTAAVIAEAVARRTAPVKKASR